jgi:putative ABC transport system substrate-binding protein
MKKAAVLSILVGGILLATGFAANAQQPVKVPRIGYLGAQSHSTASVRVDPFRQGLRELGYVEGRNIVIEWRFAEEKIDRLSALAAELGRLKVDIIVTAGRIPTRAAKEATSTIPIVMTQNSDPVANGFVASLARPGGNITGLSTLAPELSGKRLELLKEIVPKLSRVESAANSGRRSGFPSENRYSMTMFFPSIHPSFFSSCRNASKRTAIPEAVLLSKKPSRSRWARL